MIFGLLAIFCWLLLLATVVALLMVAARKNRLGTAVPSAFLLGGLAAGTFIWPTTRPEGLTFQESLKAGLTDAGLREYGHPIEHQAEVAICLSTYACIFGGALGGGVAWFSMRVIARRKTA